MARNRPPESNWPLRPGDLPRAAMARHPELGDLENNALFRWLVWRTETQYRRRRIGMHVYQWITDIGFGAMLVAGFNPGMFYSLNSAGQSPPLNTMADMFKFALIIILVWLPLMVPILTLLPLGLNPAIRPYPLVKGAEKAWTEDLLVSPLGARDAAAAHWAYVGCGRQPRRVAYGSMIMALYGVSGVTAGLLWGPGGASPAYRGFIGFSALLLCISPLTAVWSLILRPSSPEAWLTTQTLGMGIGLKKSEHEREPPKKSTMRIVMRVTIERFSGFACVVAAGCLILFAGYLPAYQIERLAATLQHPAWILSALGIASTSAGFAIGMLHKRWAIRRAPAAFELLVTHWESKLELKRRAAGEAPPGRRRKTP